jgi:hypothetical protein
LLLLLLLLMVLLLLLLFWHKAPRLYMCESEDENEGKLKEGHHQ